MNDQGKHFELSFLLMKVLHHKESGYNITGNAMSRDISNESFDSCTCLNPSVLATSHLPSMQFKGIGGRALAILNK